jgi:hypothetical protein
MKSLRVVQGANLCNAYNYHDSRGYGYKRFVILFWLDGVVWDGWNSFGVDHVDWCDP